MLIILFLILLNCAGFLLKFYGLDRHIILLGFRFHLAAFLPFLLLLFKKEFNFIKEHLNVKILSKPGAYFFAVILPIAAVAAAYFFKYILLTDPDFFYELGLSSIIDYPVYFLWNLPQLLMIGLFLLYAGSKSKFSFPTILAVSLFLFPYEFYQADKEIFQTVPAIQTGIMLLLGSALIMFHKKSIYMFSVVLFSVIWSGVLLFGSTSEAIINTFFARNYENWEGFVVPVKEFSNMGVVFYFGLSLIFFLAYLVVNSIIRKSD